MLKIYSVRCARAAPQRKGLCTSSPAAGVRVPTVARPRCGPICDLHNLSKLDRRGDAEGPSRATLRRSASLCIRIVRGRTCSLAAPEKPVLAPLAPLKSASAPLSSSQAFREREASCRPLSCNDPASLSKLARGRRVLRTREELIERARLMLRPRALCRRGERLRNITIHYPTHFESIISCTHGETASHPRVLASRHRPHNDCRRAVAACTAASRPPPPQDQDRLPREGGAALLRRLAARVPRVVAHCVEFNQCVGCTREYAP